AFDRADGAAANLRRLFVRKAADGDEDQRFALFIRKKVQSTDDFGECDGGILRGAGDQRLLVSGFVPRLLPPGAALVGIKLVGEDAKHPRFEICARLEAVAILPSLGERLLAEIVGAVALTAERAGKGAKKGNELDELGTEVTGGVRGRCLSFTV